jgi:hypothetical protein
VSVQPFRSRDILFGLEKLFFDFDSDRKNSKETYSEVRDFSNRLESVGIRPMIVKTSRGLDVYVFLRNIVEFDFGKENFYEKVYYVLQEELLRDLKYSTLNPNCLGNLKHLAEVPYSVSCSPVNRDEETIRINDLDEYKKSGIQQGLLNRFKDKARRELGLSEKQN